MGLTKGRLPARYAQPWAGRFDELVYPFLREGLSILDVGSGREPVFNETTRKRSTYVGLDVSAQELAAAPTGAYDDTYVESIAEFNPVLVEQFDLVVSWQVLEHVRPLELALANIKKYLRPGGTFVALFSGRYSPMAVLNRLFAFRIARLMNHVLLGRARDTMFPAYYDGAYASRLRSLMKDWGRVDIEPRWEAAMYFDFFAPIFRTYLVFEDGVAKHGWEDLATHYFLVGNR